MQLLADSDPTTLSYWLTWRVLLCLICVLAPILVGSYLIWKYDRDGTSHEGYYNLSWIPCLKQIHPIFLMSFRIISFCLLLVALSFDVAVHGFELFYYYTQWTLSLSVIYFGFGSFLSIHGCFQYPKINNHSKCHVPEDMEKGGLYAPLSQGAVESGVKFSERLNHPGKFHLLLTSEFWGYLFQVLFQITAGAVTLTDVVYWCVIVPFLSIRDYEMGFLTPISQYFHIVFRSYILSSLYTYLLSTKSWLIRGSGFYDADLTVLVHSLGAVLLLGDTAINSLRFPWFRISYFFWWTGIYVIFQWIVHAFVSIWWPYPFLDLSKPLAPLWYLLVALMHLPCYGIFLLIVKMKHLIMPKLFPTCYQYSLDIALQQ